MDDVKRHLLNNNNNNSSNNETSKHLLQRVSASMQCATYFITQHLRDSRRYRQTVTSYGLILLLLTIHPREKFICCWCDINEIGRSIN